MKHTFPHRKPGRKGAERRNAMWDIRAEDDRDAPAIDALVERSFGPGRYAKSAYRLREGVHHRCR